MILPDGHFCLLGFGKLNLCTILFLNGKSISKGNPKITNFMKDEMRQDEE